jgi:hypothetical protein
VRATQPAFYIPADFLGHIYTCTRLPCDAAFAPLWGPAGSSGWQHAPIPLMIEAQFRKVCPIMELASELKLLSAGKGRHLTGPNDSVPGSRVARAACRWGAPASIVLTAFFIAASFEAMRGAEPPAQKLQLETVAAFDHYVQLTDERNQTELNAGKDLLWIDTLPEAQRVQHYAALKRGEIEMERLTTLDQGKAIPCPGGMIHHWVGVAFLPGVRLGDVLDVLEDYNHQSTYYAPDVEQSRIESHDGDHFRVFLRFRRHKVITVVLNSEHEVNYFHDSTRRAHSRSSAVHIAEVENPGKPDEREKPPGDDGGFLWRMETWWRMEERDGGVYVQSEVASLTRDIPAGLGWLIGPFVTSIPKETLSFTLNATRKAVEEKVKGGPS